MVPILARYLEATRRIRHRHRVCPGAANSVAESVGDAILISACEGLRASQATLLRLDEGEQQIGEEQLGGAVLTWTFNGDFRTVFLKLADVNGKRKKAAGRDDQGLLARG